jgi:hypothetical protein
MPDRRILNLNVAQRLNRVGNPSEEVAHPHSPFLVALDPGAEFLRVWDS